MACAVGKDYGRVELIKDRTIDDAVAPELRSPVNDTMSDALRCGHFQVGQQPRDADNRVLLAGQRSILRGATRSLSSLPRGRRPPPCRSIPPHRRSVAVLLKHVRGRAELEG